MARYVLHKKSTGKFARQGTQYPTPQLEFSAPSLNEAKIYRHRSGGPGRRVFDSKLGKSVPNPEWDDLEWLEVELTIKA